jgi:hypothetical protein
MTLSPLGSRAQSRNARVGAISLASAALLTLALTHTNVSLAPLRILTLALAAFATWTFSDEMGVRKPLNRAGMIFFSIAAITKVSLSLGVAEEVAGRYYMLYAAFLLLAVLCWSVALLHRQENLKVVGAVGVLATMVPIALIVIGHIAVGLGAVWGVASLVAATDGAPMTDISFVIVVERIFGLWCYAAAWFMWRGYLDQMPPIQSQA